MRPCHRLYLQCHRQLPQRRRLLDAGLPVDLVSGITQELETCDFSRFSPGDLRLSELQEAVRRSTDLVARVDQRGGTP